jgi:hypothetical protein
MRSRPAPVPATPPATRCRPQHTLLRPTIPETRTQPATGTTRRTPTTRCHRAWASSGRRPQTAACDPPTVAGNPQKREQLPASLHGEGGHRRRRTATPRYAGGGGPRPGTVPADVRPADTTTNDTPPANNNKMAGRQMSCRHPRQPAPQGHRVMQQRCRHASASARSPSWQPMPRPRLQRAATTGQRRLSSPLRNRIFITIIIISLQGFFSPWHGALVAADYRTRIAEWLLPRRPDWGSWERVASSWRHIPRDGSLGPGVTV